jgi:hypothetical protein
VCGSSCPAITSSPFKSTDGHLSPTGELLRRAADEFDVLVTADQGIPHQQNLAKFDIAVVVLAAVSSRIEAYEPLADKLRQAVEEAMPGSALVVTA